MILTFFGLRTLASRTLTSGVSDPASSKSSRGLRRLRTSPRLPPSPLLHLLLILVVWQPQRVASIPPLEAELERIWASNRSEEEKFMAAVQVEHLRYCQSGNVCQDRTGSCHYCAPCQCDPHCERYGDCCPDRLFQDALEAPHFELKWDCRDNLYSGYTEQQRQSRLANATRYFMTTSCPPLTSDPLARDCSDPSLFAPVSQPGSGEGDPGTVFANSFCALCNGVNSAGLVSWKLLVLCKEAKNVTTTSASQKEAAQLAANDPDCYLLHFPPPSLPSPRQCYYDNTMISACNVTGAWPARDKFVERACASYLDPKKAEGRLFQNVFCYMCNSADPQLFDRKCLRTWYLRPMPFAALLDFSEDKFRRSGVEAASRCLPDEILDDAMDQCRPISCSPGRHYVDGLCVPVFGTAKGLGYSLYLSIAPEKDLDLHDGNDLLHVLPGYLEYELVQKPFGNHVRLTTFEVSFEITDEDGRCSQKSDLVRVFSTMVVMSDVFQEDLEQDLLHRRNTSLQLALTRSLAFNVTTHVDEDVWRAVNLHPSSQPSRGCSTKVSNHHSKMPGDALLTFTKVNHLLTLPKVALTRDEYRVTTPDLGLRVPWLRDALPLERYETTTEGKVFIALEDFLPKLTINRMAEERPTDEAEVVLSVVCTSLSLVGLTVTFVTYASFKSLRTTPGQNNMNLCLTLFLAQLFYLLGSGNTRIPGVCEAMGILIHYFWLSAFAAMSVCSYHMWRVFTSFKAVNEPRRHRRRLLQYTVYIWGSAAAVVVVTLLVHIIATEGDDIGYGGDRQCYLSSALGVGAAMGLPVALTVMTSVVFFSLTVRIIRSSPKLTKSKQDEHYVWVYLKLSTLTGITWGLAFVVFFTQVIALRYLFTIVNGLQGVFICLSFVCNRKVAMMYRSCCKGSHSVLESSTTDNRSSTCSSNPTLFTVNRLSETAFTDSSTLKS